MRFSLRPLLPNETDWESLSVFVLIPSAVIGRLWLRFGLPLPECTLKHLTGCPCPGCGATRAAHELLHGHTGEALKLNPLATITAFVAALWCVFAIGLLVFANNRRLRFHGAPKYTGAAIRTLLILALCANWAWVAIHLPESPWCVK